MSEAFRRMAIRDPFRDSSGEVPEWVRGCLRYADATLAGMTHRKRYAFRSHLRSAVCCQ